MLAGGKKSRLPSEYQEVEYLESTGTQYIDTGINADNNLNILLNFQYPGVFDINQSGAITVNPYNRHHLQVYQNEIMYGFGVRGDPYTLAQYDNQWHSISVQQGQIAFDGVDRVRSTQEFNLRINYWLFARNAKGLGITYSKLRLSESIVSTRRYVPCYRKSDNKPGMYDLCGSICPLTNSPFYINAGSGEFIVGLDVN